MRSRNSRTYKRLTLDAYMGQTDTQTRFTFTGSNRLQSPNQGVYCCLLIYQGSRVASRYRGTGTNCDRFALPVG